MGKEVLIDLQDFVFKGDVLAVGSDNMGVVYNLARQGEEALEIDCEEEAEALLQDNSYDNAVMFFYFSTIGLQADKKELLRNISKCLKHKGNLYIWDIDKKPFKPYKNNIKLLLPQGQSRNFTLWEYNIFMDASLNSTIKMLEAEFLVVEQEAFDGVYFIKAQKKGRNGNEESSIGGNKCEVYT